MFSWILWAAVTVIDWTVMQLWLHQRTAPRLVKFSNQLTLSELISCGRQGNRVGT